MKIDFAKRHDSGWLACSGAAAAPVQRRKDIMKQQVTIDRDDLIQLMAASELLNKAPTDKLDAAWMRCWAVLAPRSADALALHQEITAAQKEFGQ